MLNWFIALTGGFICSITSIEMALFSRTPHRTEELLSNMSLVVSLPAHFTVEPCFTLVTCEAPEHFLLHTTFWTVNVLITFAFFTAFWESFFCAHTSCNSITNPWIFFSLKAEKELLDPLRVFVLFITLFNSPDDRWCAVLGVYF